MTKLYLARMIVETVVTHPNRALAINGVVEDIKIGEGVVRDMTYIEVEHKKDLPHSWVNAIPWGEKNDRTCSQILEE
jgi:hypothetical protein